MIDGKAPFVSGARAANQQMSLGQFVEALSQMPADLPIQFEKEHPHDYGHGGLNPTHFVSWRGSYDEVSLARGPKPLTVGELLKRAREAVGGTFQGWKGGDPGGLDQACPRQDEEAKTKKPRRRSQDEEAKTKKPRRRSQEGKSE